MKFCRYSGCYSGPLDGYDTCFAHTRVSPWAPYQRKGVVELRRYKPGEPMHGISVSEADDPVNDRGYIARNPENHADQWYVAKAYFDQHYEPASTGNTGVEK